MSFEWTEELQIDNGPIDQDHKKLIDIANRILTLQRPEEGQTDELKEIVRELFEYVKHHFSREEDIMARLGYPKLEEHHEKHQIIIRDMSYHLSNAENINKLYVNFRRLATQWVIDHILEEDRKIHHFMVEKLARSDFQEKTEKPQE